MNVNLIEMPEEQAKEKLQAYRKKLASIAHSEANREVKKQYEMAIAGYRALSKGTPLIDIEEVFRKCPVDAQCRPRLAIARADRKEIKLRVAGNRYMFLTGDYYNWWSLKPGFTTSSLIVNHENPQPQNNQRVDGFARVPMIPADVYPESGTAKDWQILWEVEEWADQSLLARPDRDPYLLKHLGGMLFAVIAEWDLTELERSIMKTRID